MTAARRGEQLTQQLLAFSRRQMLRPQTLNPNRLLLDFKPLAERAAGGADRARLRPRSGARPDPRSIPAQFEAAVLNLVVNARDAMDGQGGHARIAVRSRNVHLDTAAVADRGVPPGAYVEVVGQRHRHRHPARHARSACSSRSSPPRRSARARASA